jgi:hypothetical protein
MTQKHNFYISEILHYQPATLDLEQIKKTVQDYLLHTYEISLGQIRYFNQDNEHFSIEMVRNLQWESQHAVDFASSDKMRALVLINFVSAETAAQNAALKLIEESPANTLIVIPVSDPQRLLPTIISRCKIVSLQSDFVPAEPVEATADHSATPRTYTEAIELAANYKDRNEAQDYLLQLLKLPANKDYQRQQILLSSYQALEANANVSLTLEQCFFTLVSLK